MVAELTSKEVNQLAGVGLVMVWAQGVPENITAVNLAAQLLDDLDSNKTAYNGVSILQIMQNATANATLTISAAKDILADFSSMPMSERHGLQALWTIMALISGPFLVLRLYSRIRYSGGLKKDDYFLLLAWLVATYETVNGIWLLIETQTYRHGWNVTRKQIIQHFHIGTIDEYLFGIYTTFYKTALLIFFYELYPGRIFRIYVWVIFGILLFWAVGGEIFTYFRCHPWNVWNDPFIVKCIPHWQSLVLYQIGTLMNVGIDFLIFSLPCYISYKLSMPLKQKIGVTFLMGLGMIVCIAGIMRYPTLNEYLGSNDVSWRGLDVTTWSLLEPHLGILCASIPASRKAILHMVPKLKDFLSAHGMTPDTTKQSASNPDGSALASGLRPIPVVNALNNKTTPIGELTAIMNMRTDIESGIGTTNAQHSQVEMSDLEETRTLQPAKSFCISEKEAPSVESRRTDN